MKKLVTLGMFSLLMATTSAQAITVESGSKYPIIVEVYEWKSVCKDKASSTASKTLSGAKGAYQKGGLFSALREGISGAVTGAGCDKVGVSTLLKKKGDTVNLAAGLMIVAYKDPVKAYGQGKVVNPLPAIIKIPKSGKVLLETRKNKSLGSIIGRKGDAGLKATIK